MLEVDTAGSTESRDKPVFLTFCRSCLDGPDVAWLSTSNPLGWSSSTTCRLPCWGQEARGDVAAAPSNSTPILLQDLKPLLTWFGSCQPTEPLHCLGELARGDIALGDAGFGEARRGETGLGDPPSLTPPMTRSLPSIAGLASRLPTCSDSRDLVRPL